MPPPSSSSKIIAMLDYLDFPLQSHRVIAVNVDTSSGMIRSIRIVPASEACSQPDTILAFSPPFQAARRFFDIYFASSAPHAIETATCALLPYLEIGRTPFARKVRQTLLASIALGNTATYAELASLIGNPRAARAVGQCLAKNPYHIVIPCHRIISKDPEKFYYAAGSEIKRELLKYEARCIHAPVTAQIPFC